MPRKTAADDSTSAAEPSPRPSRPRGRPRVSAEELAARIAEYCRRHGTNVTGEGLPPFPSGKRESVQHREWMALYKAHRRLAVRTAQVSPEHAAAIRDLLTAQRGRCPICRKALESGDARLDSTGAEPAALHAPCLDFLALARTLGAEALERVKGRL